MTSLFKLISSLIGSKFYGELRVKFRAGEIAHIEKHESLDVKGFQ